MLPRFLAALFVGLSISLASPLLAQDWTTVEYPVSSPSPYPNNMRSVPYEVRIEGATMVRVFFEFVDTEAQWDKIEVFDKYGRLAQRVSGRQTRFWSEPVQGDTLVLRMTTDFQGSGRGFLVTHAAFLGSRAVPPPPVIDTEPDWDRGRGGRDWGSRLDRIAIYLREGSRWIPMPDREVVDLYVGGCEHSHFDFAIRGFNRRGGEVSDFRFDPRIDFGTRRGSWATLQALGDRTYRFHVASGTVTGLLVTVYDPQHPDITARLWINIRASHSCGHSGGGRGHDDWDRGGRGGHGDDHGHDHDRGRGPAWVQIGNTWTQPSWVKNDQDMHVEFLVGGKYDQETRFKFVPGAACRVKAVSIYFTHGGREDVTTMGPYLRAGEAYEFTSKLLQSGWKIQKIWVNLNAPRNSEHRAFVLSRK